MNMFVIVTVAFNGVLALIGVILSATLIVRTKKRLDLASKFFFTASMALALGSLLELNARFDGLVAGTSFLVSAVLYSVATVFFISGGFILVRITSEANKSK